MLLYLCQFLDNFDRKIIMNAKHIVENYDNIYHYLIKVKKSRMIT